MRAWPVDALQLERACILDHEVLAASRYAVGPTRISPGRAASCRRAARFTASPVANVESALSTTTSPASIPILRFELELVDRLPHRERGADRALGVVLVRLRVRQTRP